MGIKSNTSMHSFSSGLLSPKLRAQFDLAIFPRCFEDGDNFIPLVQGPARFREGSKFVRETSKYATLIPFVFSDEQSYMLEFTHRRVRVFKDGELIVDPTGIGPATGAVIGGIGTRITLPGHGFVDWNEVVLTGMQNPELNGNWIIKKHTDDVFEISAALVGTFTASPASMAYKVASYNTPYRAYDDGDPDTANPGSVAEVEDPENEISFLLDTPEFYEIQFAQAFDTMYIVHRTCAPRKLVRSSDISWALSTYTRTTDPFSADTKYPRVITFFENRLMYAYPNDAAAKILGSKTNSFTDHTTGSAATDAIEFQAGSRRTLNSVRWLIGNDEYLVAGGSEGPDRVFASGDAALSATNVNIKPLDNFGVAGVMPVLIGKDIVYVQKDLKRLRSIQYNRSADNYEPVDITKYCDEILKGKVQQMTYVEGDPNTLWICLQNGQLVAMNMDSQEGILAWHKHSSGNALFKSVAKLPVRNGYDQLWWIAEREIAGETKYCIEYMTEPRVFPRREEYYSGDSAEAKAEDLAEFQDDMAEAMKHAYHVDCGGTYDGSLIDGFISSSTTPLNVGSGISIIGANDIFEGLTAGRLLIQKDGPGRAVFTNIIDPTQATIQVTTAFDLDPDEDGFYVMEAGSFYFTATSVSGLDHLEGETVTIVADGVKVASQVVEDGAITISEPATVIHVGLPYSGYLKTVNLESGGVNGPAQGKLKNVQKLVIRFLDTLGVKYGTSPYGLSEIPWRTQESQIGRPPPLLSGETPELPVMDDSATEKHVYIRQDEPYPCTVQAIIAFLDTGVI